MATILRVEHIEVAGIQTIIVGLSPLLADLIHRLAEEQIQLEIIAVLESRDSLMGRLQSLAPALILLGLRVGEDDATAASLANLMPGVRVLAFARDASHAFLHQAGKPARAFVDPSPRELISALTEGLDPAVDRI
jgi:hypothetical protein